MFLSTRRVFALITLIALIATAGCATIFTGTSGNVVITTEPSSAKVTVDGMYMGVSPVTASLKRDKDHMVVVKKEGYEDATANITRSFNAVAILNLAGLLCWVVDFVTGAAWKFDRDAVSINLEKTDPKRSGNLMRPGKLIAGDKMTIVPYEGNTALLYNARTAD